MTVIENQTAAAYQYAELWRALMPDVQQPEEEQFLCWAGNYTEKQVTRGINGAARKLQAMHNASRSMTPEDVAKYASSIMRNEALGVRRFA